jgi:uncharacterized membrane protein
MKITTKQLQRIIREELANLSEITVGDHDIDPGAGELPDHIDIVNDLINAMTGAGKQWLQMATKGQAPAEAAKYEQIFSMLEDALIKAAQSPSAHEDPSQSARKGVYNVMKESKKKNRSRKTKTIRARRKNK